MFARFIDPKKDQCDLADRELRALNMILSFFTRLIKLRRPLMTYNKFTFAGHSREMYSFTWKESGIMGKIPVGH